MRDYGQNVPSLPAEEAPSTPEQSPPNSGGDYQDYEGEDWSQEQPDLGENGRDYGVGVECLPGEDCYADDWPWAYAAGGPVSADKDYNRIMNNRNFDRPYEINFMPSIQSPQEMYAMSAARSKMMPSANSAGLAALAAQQKKKTAASSPADGYNFGFARGGMAPMPEYQAGGKLLRGPGDGMSDDIPAVIRGKGVQRAALADGEFVIPADVVSHLGNGSTEAGAKKLYQMMALIRKARTGKSKQAPQVKVDKFLPVPSRKKSRR